MIVMKDLRSFIGTSIPSRLFYSEIHCTVVIILIIKGSLIQACHLEMIPNF
jgi:hypothetical protein